MGRAVVCARRANGSGECCGARDSAFCVAWNRRSPLLGDFFIDSKNGPRRSRGQLENTEKPGGRRGSNPVGQARAARAGKGNAKGAQRGARGRRRSRPASSQAFVKKQKSGAFPRAAPKRKKKRKNAQASRRATPFPFLEPS